METKTLDERIRERGVAEWKKRVQAVWQSASALAHGDFRGERMEIKTQEQNGKQTVTIWQCIDRLFEAMIAAGAKRAGDDAVAEFLARFDQLGDEIDELRADQNT